MMVEAHLSSRSLRAVVAIAAIGLLGAMPGVVRAQEMACLDLSSGFNMDSWAGAREVNYVLGLSSTMYTQFGEEVNGQANKLINQYGGWYFVCNTTSGGFGTAYNGTWVTGTQGTPEDGVVEALSSDWVYHIASHVGNATLSGDWTEVETLSQYANRSNTMAAGKQGNWAVSSVTATLPVGQQDKYTSMNILLAVGGGSQTASGIKIQAVYTDDSTDDLHTFTSELGGPRPLVGDTYTGFSMAYKCLKLWGGNLYNYTPRLWEFETALSLNNEKNLKGIRLVDTTPGTTGRELVVFGASACLASAGGGLDAPTNVAATDGTFSDKVQVTWDSVTGAASYDVYRNTTDDSGTASLLDDTENTSFDDTTAASGTTYYYWVKASDGQTTSDFSNSDSGHFLLPAPTNVAATDGAYSDKVRVTWDAVSGADSYDVYRNTTDDSGSATLLGNTGNLQYDDGTAAAGTTYYYWVKAVKNGGGGSFSASNSGFSTCPIAVAGNAQSVTDFDWSEAETVTLDGSGSSAQGGTIVSWVWKEDGEVIATGQTAQVSLSRRLHIITLEVTDSYGHTSTDTVNVRVYYAPLPVCLDISSGFNMDSWAGVNEVNYAISQSLTMYPMFGEEVNGQANKLVNAYGGWYFVCNTTSGGFGTAYYGNNWVDGTWGTPEDGVVLALDSFWIYHIASHLGNETLPGDWTELETMSQYGNAANTMAAGRQGNWQVTEVTATLPAGQQEPYANINILLAVGGGSQTASGIKIQAVYSDDSTDDLHTFTSELGGPRPLVGDTYTGFSMAYKCQKIWSGTTLYNYTPRLWEFDAPVTVNSQKTLKGIRLVDTTTAVTGRELVIFAASGNPTDAVGVNLSPLADAGEDDDEIYDNDANNYEIVTLDGSGSYDMDGDVVSWVWKEGETQIAAGETPEVTLGVGTHTITLTVTDNEDEVCETADTVVIVVNPCQGNHTYYVDYASGSDSNYGTSAQTAWQHCPGDVNATGYPASTTLYFNDKVIFKGGVNYHGKIICSSSGMSGQPVIYDGNTEGTFGTGRAIIDGGAPVTGWTQCQSADDCDGNPNYANIYYTYAPLNVGVSTALLMEDREFLCVAQDPNATDYFYFQETASFPSWDDATTTTIRDDDYFTQPSGYWDGPTCVYVLCGNNNWHTVALTGYDPSTHTITISQLPESPPLGLYGMVNSLKILDVAGEYVVRTDQTDAYGHPKIYMWPLTPGVSGKLFTVSRGESGFSFPSSTDYVTIQGFHITGTANGVYRLSSVYADDISILDNFIDKVVIDGIAIYRGDNLLVEGNTVRQTGGRGMVLDACQNSTVYDNWIEYCNNTGMDLYSCTNCEVLCNTLTQNKGHHANDITLSGDDTGPCTYILVAGNRVYDSATSFGASDTGCTICRAAHVTYIYNLVESVLVNSWEGQDHLEFYNNTIIGLLRPAATCTNFVSKNNIIAGGSAAIKLPDSDVGYNAFIQILWDQTSFGPGEFQTTAAALWVDPDNGDYHLKSDSPARDAGTDLGLDEDIEGHTVPYGDYPDIGAFEYTP